MPLHLTDAIVKKLPPPERGSKVHYDTTVRGFGCCVTRAGARSFIFNYRVRSTGRERRIVIGRYPDWVTTAARDEAKRLRRLIDAGGDPLAGIEAEREAVTMAELIDRFEAEHLVRLRPATQRSYRQMLTNHIRPHFGKHTKVTDVGFADVDALHRKASKVGPYIANRSTDVVRKIFSLSIRWGLRSDNPAVGIERNFEAKRKRYLSADELARLTAALAAHPDRQVADIIRMALLTGARIGEIFSMRFDAISEGIWTKLASTTKQKADHVVPLSAPAQQLLAEIRSRHDDAVYVFPGKGRTGHVTVIDHSWATIKAAAGISNLRVHDLRHSFASQLASSGASLPLIGALLGHSNPATTARYAHLFQDPQRAAVERVGATILNAGKDAVAPTPLKRGC
jgi:integrase